MVAGDFVVFLPFLSKNIPFCSAFISLSLIQTRLQPFANSGPTIIQTATCSKQRGFPSITGVSKYKYPTLCSSAAQNYLHPLAVRTQGEALVGILIWCKLLTHFPVIGISDKTTVTMGNLQANLFFLHVLGDPSGLENPTKIAYRKYVKQCTKTIHSCF